MVPAEAIPVMKSVESLIRSRNHRPRNPDSGEYHEFMSKQYETAKKISLENPELNINEFLDFFSPDNP